MSQESSLLLCREWGGRGWGKQGTGVFKTQKKSGMQVCSDLLHVPSRFEDVKGWVGSIYACVLAKKVD